MEFEQDSQDLPGIEDTIRATLRAINARNGTNFFMPVNRIGADALYTSDDPEALALDNENGSQSMNPRTVAQSFQPELAGVLAQLAPGSDGGSNGRSSPQDLARALRELPSSDPLDVLRPYLDANQGVRAVPLANLEGSPEQIRASNAAIVDSAQGPLLPNGLETPAATQQDSEQRNGKDDTSNSESPDVADRWLIGVTDRSASGTEHPQTPGLKVHPSLQSNVDRMRASSSDFANMSKRLENSTYPYEIRLGKLPAGTPAQTECGRIAGCTMTFDPEQIANTEYIAESGDRAHMSIERAIAHEVSHAYPVEALSFPWNKIPLSHKYVIDSENNIMQRVDPISPRRSRNDDSLPQQKITR